MLDRVIWLFFDYFVGGKRRPAVRSRTVTVIMFVGYIAAAMAVVWAIYAR
jgi:hypothetical protein